MNPLLVLGLFGAAVAGAWYFTADTGTSAPKAPEPPGPEPQPEPEPEQPGPPEPGPQEPEPPVGLDPQPSYPPEPAGGWDAALTPLTAAQALEQIRAAQTTTTVEKTMKQALEQIYPGTEWLNPLGPWQQEAQAFLFNQWRFLAGVEEFPNDPVSEAAALKLWLLGRRTLIQCQEEGETGDDLIGCAAVRIYPEAKWEGPNQGLPWQQIVYQRLNLMAQEL